MIVVLYISNWDVLYVCLVLKVLGVYVCIIIKDSYMKLLFGLFVCVMGGIGIDCCLKYEGELCLSMV